MNADSARPVGLSALKGRLESEGLELGGERLQQLTNFPRLNTSSVCNSTLTHSFTIYSRGRPCIEQQ